MRFFNISRGLALSAASVMIFATGSMAIAAPSNSNENIIPDAKLKECIAKELHKPVNSSITENDLTGLTEIPICQKVADLTGLEKATNLIKADFYAESSAQKPPIDLTPLTGLTKLQELSISNYKIVNPNVLASLKNLTHLELYQSVFPVLTPLSGLTKLKILNLTDAGISDISPLAGLTNLDLVYLERNQITDISPLAGLTKLTGLAFNNNQVSDLTPLRSLTNLDSLDFMDNKVQDLTPIQNLSKLKSLQLFENPVKDFRPIANLKNQLSSMPDDLDGIATLEVTTDRDGYASLPVIPVPGDQLNLEPPTANNQANWGTHHVSLVNGKLKLSDGFDQGLALLTSTPTANNFIYGALIKVIRGHSDPTEENTTDNPPSNTTDNPPSNTTDNPPSNTNTGTDGNLSDSNVLGSASSTGDSSDESASSAGSRPGTGELKIQAVSGSPGLNANQVYAGDYITVEVNGFIPNQYVYFELHSTPVYLGRAVADQFGNARLRAHIPASTTPGLHYIWAKQDKLVAKTPIWVHKKGSNSPASQHNDSSAQQNKNWRKNGSGKHSTGYGLANTGTQTGGLLLAATLLIVAGSGLVSVRRFKL